MEASYGCAQEGVLALWKGWLPSVIGVVPYVGLNFAVYETSKDAILQYYGEAPALLTPFCTPRYVLSPISLPGVSVCWACRQRGSRLTEIFLSSSPILGEM